MNGKFGDILEWIFEEVGNRFLFALLLLGPAVLGLQCYWYLKDGFWTAISVRDGLNYTFDRSWEFGWKGIENIVVWMPLSLAMFIVYLIALLYIGTAFRAFQKSRRNYF